MTALNIATDIPPTIDSLEKLVAWASFTLNHLYPNTVAIEGSDSENAVYARVAQSNPYYITADADNPTWRLINRSSLKIDSAWQSGATKLWENVQPLGALPIPEEFKS